MGAESDSSCGDLPAGGQPGITPDVVRSYRYQLTPGEDVIDPATWAGSVPQVNGIAPRVRVGCQKWFNLLWLLPIGFLLLIIAVAIAKGLRGEPSVQRFIRQYPGTVQASPPARTAGFPAWVDLQHFLNRFFMIFIIRAGVQILSDHPRLYWTRHCTPGTGSGSNGGSPRIPCGRPSRIRSAFRVRWACRAFATRLAWPAGGISAWMRCGCSTA